jgi:hypothetical protein
MAKTKSFPGKISAGDARPQSILIAEIQTFKHSIVTTMFQDLTGHRHRRKSKSETFTPIR